MCIFSLCDYYLKNNDSPYINFLSEYMNVYFDMHRETCVLLLQKRVCVPNCKILYENEKIKFPPFRLFNAKINQ